MFLVATHSPGVNKEESDFLSRNFSDNNIEWSLNPDIFDILCNYTWGTPPDRFVCFKTKQPISEIC